MKILVTCRTLRRDRTSEGICSSKFILALAAQGYEVECLTSEIPDETEAELLLSESAGRLRIWPVSGHETPSPWRTAARVKAATARAGRIIRRFGDKCDAVAAYYTGWHSAFWNDVCTWQAAIGAVCATTCPDAIVTRAAGITFEPHIAMLGLDLRVPWIANYHDPYPISLYPEPYAKRTPILAARQEAIHYRILAQADALTFPSVRLLDWVLAGPATGWKRKAFVVPHLASDLGRLCTEPRGPDSQAPGFSVVHTGTLLGHRDPEALIKGFLDFIDSDSEKLERARLVLVGRVQSKIRDGGCLQAVRGHKSIVIREERVPYDAAMSLVKNSTAGIVLEARGPESPFFPAKLADICWLNKPVVAISPALSTVRDLLGAAYPLLAKPGCASDVTRALHTLWRHWKGGRLGELAPPADLRHRLAVSSVVGAFESALGHVTRLAPAVEPRRRPLEVGKS